MVAKADFAEEDDIEVAVIEALFVEYLLVLEVDDLTKVQDGLDDIQIEFAEDGMVVVQTQMAHVHLDLRITCSRPFALSKFLSDLKEAFLDFALHAGFQLLFHVV